jgi:hypothetical protein
MAATASERSAGGRGYWPPPSVVFPLPSYAWHNSHFCRYSSRPAETSAGSPPPPKGLAAIFAALGTLWCKSQVAIATSIAGGSVRARDRPGTTKAYRLARATATAMTTNKAPKRNLGIVSPRSQRPMSPTTHGALRLSRKGSSWDSYKIEGKEKQSKKREAAREADSCTGRAPRRRPGPIPPRCRTFRQSRGDVWLASLRFNAWSEANHDLGYKPGSKPLDSEAKRRLAFTSAQAWGADRVFDELFRERSQAPMT